MVFENEDPRPEMAYWSLDTIKTTTQENVVRESDMSLWKKVLSHINVTCPDRQRCVNDKSVKPMIVALRDRYRASQSADGTAPMLRPLGSRTTPIGLALAASLGNALAVKIILSSSAFKEMQSESTPDEANFVLDHALFFAVYSGQDAAIPVLLKKGASVNGCSYRSIGSPLQASVSAKTEKLTRMLLSKGAKNHDYVDVADALHIAVRNGSEKTVILLLDNGYQVNSVAGNVTEGICHQSPLTTAALNGKEKMVEFLLAHGADVDMRFNDCPYGFTALRCATKLGNFDAVRLLLKHGANPCIGLYSALHDAAFYGYIEAVELLLPKMPSINYIKTGDIGSPITPLDSALTIDPYMRRGPDYLNIVRLLLEKGATTRHKRDALRKETDLHWWAQLRHPSMTGYRTLGPRDSQDFEAIFRILLDRGEDINARDREGRTPLHRAVQPTWKDSISHLRKQWGAEIGAPHNPLPHISLLIEHGAVPSIKDNNGKTPMDLANEAKWEAEYMKQCPPW